MAHVKNSRSLDSFCLAPTGWFKIHINGKSAVGKFKHGSLLPLLRRFALLIVRHGSQRHCWQRTITDVSSETGTRFRCLRCCCFCCCCCCCQERAKWQSNHCGSLFTVSVSCLSVSLCLDVCMVVYLCKKDIIQQKWQLPVHRRNKSAEVVSLMKKQFRVRNIPAHNVRFLCETLIVLFLCTFQWKIQYKLIRYNY